MFDKIKSLFKKPEIQPELLVEQPTKEVKHKKTRVKKPKPVAPDLTSEENATMAG
jgi:hypothetical protein